ncbi:MAG: hypothetical protein ACK5VW_00015 [Holosporales bacterium]|jgi:hypothetical protein
MAKNFIQEGKALNYTAGVDRRLYSETEHHVGVLVLRRAQNRVSIILLLSLPG